MDLEQLVRRAAQGDVKAFVALTQRFQHFAFGSALVGPAGSQRSTHFRSFRTPFGHCQRPQPSRQNLGG